MPKITKIVSVGIKPRVQVPKTIDMSLCVNYLKETVCLKLYFKVFVSNSPCNTRSNVSISISLKLKDEGWSPLIIGPGKRSECLVVSKLIIFTLSNRNEVA